MNNICYFVNSYVSTPEFICSTPAPSLEDQFVGTLFANAPILVAAGAGSVLMLSPWASRNVRLIANGFLMSASLATAGGATLVASTVDVATRAVVGLGGLVYGARNIHNEMNANTQPTQPTQITEPTQPSETVRTSLILPETETLIREGNLAILNTPLTKEMVYEAAATLMGRKIESFQTLCLVGLCVIDNSPGAAINACDKQIINNLFIDLNKFLKIYDKKVVEIMKEPERQNVFVDANGRAFRLINEMRRDPLLGAPFFYAHQLYSIVKTGLSGREYEEGTLESTWRKVFNDHCQAYKALAEVNVVGIAEPAYRDALKPDLSSTRRLNINVKYPVWTPTPAPTAAQ